MQVVYLEKNIAHHSRVQRILEKIKPTTVIECDHYKEVFNPKNQNFRIQKQQPALILAEKKGNRVFASPPGFGIGGEKNYYFSHMLNCLYDCRYCFLQGMYSSANYVMFVNYEDFMQEIQALSKAAATPVYFFSGYDCDSLAFEPMTQFIDEFIPFFRGLNNAVLELRTKSTQVKKLLNHAAFPHCVVAFSFTPDEISKEVEHKVPALSKRLEAMSAVAAKGWPIGIRLDPLIYHPRFKQLYRKLIEDIFQAIPASSLHSVSVGLLRFPEKMYQTLVKLYPQDRLLAHPLYRQGDIFSYRKELEQEMKKYIYSLLKEKVDSTLLFECQS